MFNNLKGRVNKFLGNSIAGGMVWSWLMPGEWGKGDLIKQYQNVVYPIISAIAEESAKIDLRVEKNNNPVEKHDFLSLIRKPNGMMSQFQFLELHFTYMKLCGESYWYIVDGERTKKPKELYLLRPDRMQVSAKKTGAGEVTGYVYTTQDSKKKTFDVEEILHFKMPNPANPYYGLSPVQAGKLYVETEKHSSEWTRNAIYNSGRPSGVLNFKGTIDDSQFQKMKRQVKNEYTGTKNAGKLLLLKGMDDIKFERLGMELGDLALKEIKDMTRDDIMLMFRLSKTMLGISDDVNRANAQENHAVFTENIIKPELDRFVDHLNAFFIDRFGEGFTVSYRDIDLRSDKEKLEEWKTGHNKWLTTNDIRRERGLEEVQGGDELYQSVALVPINYEPEETEEEPKKEKLKSLKLKKTKEEVFREVTIRHQDLWIKQYIKHLNKEFRTQEKEILSRQKKQLLAEWSFDRRASKQRIIGFFSPMAIEVMREAAEFAFELIEDVDTTFAINERITQYVEMRTSRFADMMNDTTIKQLEVTLNEGIANGENLDKLRKRVQAVYTEATKVRSNLIARTEALAASNEGANEAYRQSPLVNAKEWSANYGACEFCNTLDGKVIGLDEDYFKIGQTIAGEDGGSMVLSFEDISHPPVHPNCRCSLLPVIID